MLTILKPLGPRHIWLFILAQLEILLMQISTKVDEINVNPVLNFFFALKAPESKRQYPERFEKFLDYLKLEGTFEDIILMISTMLILSVCLQNTHLK